MLLKLVTLHQIKDWLKNNVRKLKNLGLTISRRYHPGYELSPRGKAFLRMIPKR